MDNREQYRALLAEHGITQAKSAALLCEQTKRPCAVRTVRAWLGDPEKTSSNPCPDWAVSALKAALADRAGK